MDQYSHRNAAQAASVGFLSGKSRNQKRLKKKKQEHAICVVVLVRRMSYDEEEEEEEVEGLMGQHMYFRCCCCCCQQLQALAFAHAEIAGILFHRDSNMLRRIS